jgi:hypothetical protein
MHPHVLQHVSFLLVIRILDAIVNEVGARSL